MKRLLTAISVILILTLLSSCASSPVDAYAIESSDLETEAGYAARAYAARGTRNSVEYFSEEDSAEDYFPSVPQPEGIAEALTGSSAFSSLTIDQKLKQLQILFPDGSYWNCAEDTGGSLTEYLSAVSYVPCNHSEEIFYCREYSSAFHDYFDYDTNIQCLGFAGLLSDLLFGEDSPVTVFYDFESLEIGDHIRLNDYEHSMIVTSISGTTIGVAECNQDYETCEIGWNRQVDISDIECYDYEYMGRR